MVGSQILSAKEIYSLRFTSWLENAGHCTRRIFVFKKVEDKNSTLPFSVKKEMNSEEVEKTGIRNTE